MVYEAAEPPIHCVPRLEPGNKEVRHDYYEIGLFGSRWNPMASLLRLRRMDKTCPCYPATHTGKASCCFATQRTSSLDVMKRRLTDLL